MVHQLLHELRMLDRIVDVEQRAHQCTRVMQLVVSGFHQLVNEIPEPRQEAFFRVCLSRAQYFISTSSPQRYPDMINTSHVLVQMCRERFPQIVVPPRHQRFSGRQVG